jgi:uncharacterized tellurite resistance protein B-like protein
MTQSLKKEELKTALAALLFSVADSDGQVSPEELETIREEVFGGEESEHNQQMLALAQDLARDPRLLRESLRLAAAALSGGNREDFLLLAESVSKADGRVSREEVQTVRRIVRALV